MKPSEFFSALLSFFNDFIGMAAPGFIFLMGLLVMQEPTEVFWQEFASHSEGAAWLIGVVLSYAIGHILLSLRSAFVLGIQKLFGGDSKNIASGAFIAFKEIVLKKLGGQGLEEHDVTATDVRSLAMSVSAEAAELGRRFMFISLFCNGAATGLCILVITSFACSATVLGASWITRGVIVVAAALLFWRGSEFERRAKNVPFPVALSAVLFGEKPSDKKGE